jgi:hypothetical protein
MKNLSNWRSVRIFETEVETHLRHNYSLRLHGFFLGSLTLGATWLTSHLLMANSDPSSSLAVRYLISLSLGYLVYLALLRWWAAVLLRQEKAGDAVDLGLDLTDLSELRIPRGSRSEPPFTSGEGGDFAGGGASGDFSGASSEAGSALSDAASGALEAAGSADEGAVVVIPVLAVFFIGAALVFGAGSLLLAMFGWEVLLNVAVELAFSYAAARTAVHVTREGWLSAAVRLTWKPMLGVVICAVALGFAIDRYMPQANSLPQAIELMRA